VSDGGPAAAAQVRARRIPFRPDIEGLRGAALVFALMAHGGVPLASGGFVGVDIFFVISGFLITSLLVAEARRSGRISLGRFYAHRMKRLLPLAALVLVVTAVGAAILLPASQQEVVAGDLRAAALHFVNWQFVAQSVDYFGPETAASPVMHYWSLSIEEQFYVVWALVLVGVAWWCARTGRDIRAVLLWVVVGLTAASLAYSAWYSAEVPSAAYFSTLTRAWQIGVGALVALVALPAITRSWCWALSLGGVAAIIYAVLAYDSHTVYPGLAALAPVLGTAALIIAGTGVSRSVVQRFLSTRPMVYLGGVSYAWYLWHYPVMIFGIAAFGPLPYAQTTLLVFAAGIPAIVSHHLIGQPLRYSRPLSRFPRRAVVAGTACTVAAVGAATMLTVGAPDLSVASLEDAKGASTLRAPKLQRSADAVRPEPTQRAVREDRGAVWHEGCMLEPLQTRSGECEFGRRDGRRTVALFGDSHAMHFFPAVERVAEERGWRLLAFNKAGCPPYDLLVYNPEVDREFHECREWHANVLERLDAERPSIVFTAGAIWHKVVRDGEVVRRHRENTAALEPAYVRMLERLTELSPRVVALKDLPKAPHDMTDCVSENLDDLERCAFDRDQANPDHFEVRAARAVEGVELIDLTPALCSQGRCFGVLENTLVYRDDDHMTATFSATLRPWLARELGRSQMGP
jgi:peptidoglycan/LPS O-acetylase OafA/YrhL